MFTDPVRHIRASLADSDQLPRNSNQGSGREALKKCSLETGPILVNIIAWVLACIVVLYVL